MSEQTVTSLPHKVRFVRPDMPLTLWTGICFAVSWLLYSAGCAIVGYYLYCGIALHASSSPEPQQYRLSEEHYIYKKRPLPVPVEETDVSVSGESDAERPVAGGENADLEARVKQAIADIDQ